MAMVRTMTENEYSKYVEETFPEAGPGTDLRKFYIDLFRKCNSDRVDVFHTDGSVMQIFRVRPFTDPSKLVTGTVDNRLSETLLTYLYGAWQSDEGTYLFKDQEASIRVTASVGEGADVIVTINYGDEPWKLEKRDRIRDIIKEKLQQITNLPIIVIFNDVPQE